jgi:predicted RNase H-like HicB family nuclease
MMSRSELIAQFWTDVQRQLVEVHHLSEAQARGGVAYYRRLMSPQVVGDTVYNAGTREAADNIAAANRAGRVPKHLETADLTPDRIRHYSMLIQWSEADYEFVVTLPEFPGHTTHGISYEDAARSGRELLDQLMAAYDAEGRTLPEPSIFRPAVPAA